MKRAGKIITAVIILVVIVAGFYFLSGFISSATGYTIKSDDPAAVSECLKEKKVILYTSVRCPDCDRQVKEISELRESLEIVDCSQNSQRCLVLSQLPAFEYQKSLSYGLKTTDEVRELTDC